MAATVKSGVENVMNKFSLGSSAQEPSPEALQELKAKFSSVGQDHVFNFYDELSTADKAALFQQLSNMDPQRISVSCIAKFINRHC
jgi:UDP-N-acetylglucosamine/UDP-N-acetylgalactosamine diphosphorylase